MMCRLCLLIAFVLGTPAAVVAEKKPNIVLFFVDDLGQRDLSCYGSSLYETPHIDQRGLTNGRALATSNAPLRQGKGSIFEGGTRVPLIVSWPGKVTAGSVSDVQVTGTDHHPTILQLAGLDLRPEQHVDGYSYLKALQGESYRRKPMFWYKWQARPDSTGDTRALSMIDGRYKIVQWIDEDLVELFDLEQDVAEATNLAPQMKQKTEKMLAKLLETEQSIGSLREKGERELNRRLEKAAARKRK